MKKRTYVMLTLLCLALLAGCSCDHEWKDADCANAKTCALCGETEGAPLGHTWAAATCLNAKTCQTCGQTEGEALGHSWVEADCENPRHCTNPGCGEKEGEALGHSWLDATTETPKTCQTCSKTEGSAIDTDPRFTTAACKDLFGTWTCSYTVDGETQLGVSVPGQDLDILTCITFTFRNDGTMEILVEMEEESFKNATRIVTIEMMYAAFEDEGLSRSEANLAMQQQYGMTVEEYVDDQLNQFDASAYNQNTLGVYYVENGVIYSSDSWTGSMDPMVYTLSGDQLSITDELGETQTLTRVTE